MADTTVVVPMPSAPEKEAVSSKRKDQPTTKQAPGVKKSKKVLKLA